MANGVLIHGQFTVASSAKDRFFIELPLWPDGGIAASRFLMAFVAWIVRVATMKLDGDDVELGMIVNTTGLAVYYVSFYFMAFTIQ